MVNSFNFFVNEYLFYKFSFGHLLAFCTFLAGNCSQKCIFKKRRFEGNYGFNEASYGCCIGAMELCLDMGKQIKMGKERNAKKLNYP